MIFVIGLWTLLRVLLFGAAAVTLENLALRHQLLVLQRSVSRPRLARWDRILWVWLSRLWTSWRSSLVIVQPATVLAWHRQGFRLYWRWKSKPHRVGRPKLDAEMRHLIQRMARENPTWSRRRIRAELAGFFERAAYEAVRRRLKPDLQVAVTIAYTYGWRVQEIVGLERRQLDLERGSLRLDPGTTQNDEGRVVYLTPELARLLGEQLERIRAVERKTGRIIPYLSGRRRLGHRRRDFRKAWAEACTEAGCPGCCGTTFAGRPSGTWSTPAFPSGSPWP
jgi:integrase